MRFKFQEPLEFTENNCLSLPSDQLRDKLRDLEILSEHLLQQCSVRFVLKYYLPLVPDLCARWCLRLHSSVSVCRKHNHEVPHELGMVEMMLVAFGRLTPLLPYLKTYSILVNNSFCIYGLKQSKTSIDSLLHELKVFKYKVLTVEQS